MIRLFACLFFATVLPLAAYSAGGYWQIDVNSDMTPAGRAARQPSPGHPVYYIPYVGGYRQRGATVAGEVPPSQKEVINKLARVLAQEGYLSSQLGPLSPNQEGSPSKIGFIPTPAIVLVINWGYINPVIIDADDQGSILANHDEMLMLVGGSGTRNLTPGHELQDMSQGMWTDRYFTVVEAFAYQPYVEQHKKVLLWITKMSMPSDGVTMTQVMPSLIASGGPLFGRETVRPKMVHVPEVPTGTVEVGVPLFKEYIDAPAHPAKATPAPSSAQK